MCGLNHFLTFNALNESACSNSGVFSVPAIGLLLALNEGVFKKVHFKGSLLRKVVQEFMGSHWRQMRLLRSYHHTLFGLEYDVIIFEAYEPHILLHYLPLSRFKFT